MISKENIEQCKEALYIFCKGKETFCIGGLMKLRQIVDDVLNDTTPIKFRIVEICHYLNNKNYIEYKQVHATNLFTDPLFFITQKLWDEMQEKEKLGETEEAKLSQWY